MREAPELKQEPKVEEGLYKKETPPDYYDGGATEEKAAEMEEEVSSRIKEDEGAIQGTRQKIEDKISEASEPEMHTMESYMELPAGTPAVFNSLPEVAPFITELMEKINKGKDAKGLKKMFGGIARGLANDNLEFAEKGANRVVANRMDIYKKALEEGGPDLAWKFVVAVGGPNKYVGIKDGKIVYEGVYGNDSGISGNDRQ